MVGCGACVKARSRFYAGIIGTAVHRLPTEGDMAPTVVASPLKRILWENVERVPPSANEGQGWVVSRCAPASTHCWPTTRADKMKGQPGLRSVLCGRLCVVVGFWMFFRTPPTELHNLQADRLHRPPTGKRTTCHKYLRRSKIPSLVLE